MFKVGQIVTIVKDIFGHGKPIGTDCKILDVMKEDKDLPYLIEKESKSHPLGIWIGDKECKKLK